jgi:hypothetical protein
MVNLSESEAAKVENALEKGAAALEQSNPDLAAELTSAREIITKLLDQETGEGAKEGGPAPPFG